MSFVHVTDPYASEDSSAQQASQPILQHNTTQYALPPLSQQSSPQYIDVAASSLKAMIDPNLESAQDTLSKDDGSTLQPDGAMPSVTDVADAENINETIMKALRNTDEQVKGL